MKRNLTFKDCIVLAFSTMIGWGWIMLAATWSSDAGILGAIISFFIGMILCIFIGMVYAELTVLLPYAGGEVVFAEVAMGRNVSWLTGWCLTLAYLGVAAWEGPALVTALDYLIGIPKRGYLYTINGFEIYISWLIIVITVSLIMIFINLKGMTFSVKFQRVATIIMVLGGAVFLICSLFLGSIDNVVRPLINSSGVSKVLLAVPAMYVGFDVIPQVTEELNIQTKKIPIAIIGSIIMAALWYIGVIIAVSMACPVNISVKNQIPVAYAFSYLLGNELAGKFLIICAIFGILTSWNGFFIGASKVLTAMGEKQMLPNVFAKKGKDGTNYFSIVFVGGFCIGAAFLGANALGWLVNISSFATVITYFMVALSFVIIRKKNKMTKLKNNGSLIGILAICVSVLYIILYLPIGPGALSKVEWLLISVWLITGSGIWFVKQYKNK